MTADHTPGRHGMQNPGDLRGMPSEKDHTLILPSNKADLVDPNGFHKKVVLPGGNYTEDDEAQALKETTY